MVDPHDVVMTGENSFVRLSNDGGKTIADRVSHWRVLWSPAVNGVAATAKVFPQERFGKASSSCCLAWSESWTRPRS
jgi:hypothetical protein